MARNMAIGNNDTHVTTAQLIVLGCVLLTAGLLLIPPPAASMTFLNVGQGDAMLLQDGSQQILIDGGAGNHVVHEVGQELPWFDRTIEVVFNTHPDRDHLEGLVHLLEHYEVRLVVVPYIPHTSQLYREWLTRLETAARHQGTVVHFAHEGQRLTVSDIRLAILGPAVGASPRKVNNASIITKVEFAGLDLLLTGDAEASVERALVEKYGAALASDVLKAGHHGSKTSTSQELLTAVAPAAVVISVGADNAYGHPHPTVLERLKATPLLRTDRDGTVRLVRANETWLLSCGPRNWLHSREKQCITQALQTN